jgi:hypothetical protein
MRPEGDLMNHTTIGLALCGILALGTPLAHADHDDGDAAAAGVLGFVLGQTLSPAHQVYEAPAQVYRYDYPDYGPPRDVIVQRTYVEPRVIYYDDDDDYGRPWHHHHRHWRGRRWHRHHEWADRDWHDHDR